MLKNFISLCKAHREIVYYLFFGVATTFTNWLVYALTVEFIQFSITVGNTIAWIVAMVFAFFTNKVFVFQSRSWRLSSVFREANSFFGARMITGLIELIGVPLLFSFGLDYPLFGIQGFSAKLLIGIIVIFLNYIFSKIFIFRH